MKNMRFKAKVIQTGGTQYAFYIPKQYVKDDHIDPDKEYWIEWEETDTE